MEEGAWDRVIFSIIIPVHNAKKYIREAVDSALAQRVDGNIDIEVILAENGSDDGSAEICDEYAQKNGDSRVRVKAIHMGKASAYEARQEGVKISRGDWIVFMDADDKISPELITGINAEIARLHDDRKVLDAILYNAAELQTPDRKMFNFPFRENYIYGPEEREDFHRLMCSGDSLNAMWNKCLKRDLAQEACMDGKRSLNFGEDLLQSAAIIDKAKGIAYLDRIMYLYRINEEGLTGSYHEEFLDNQAKAWAAFDDYAVSWCGAKYSGVITKRKTLTCSIGMKRLIYSSLTVREIKEKLRIMMGNEFYKQYAGGELPDWAPEEDVFVHGLQTADNPAKKLMNSCRKYKLKSYIKERIR